MSQSEHQQPQIPLEQLRKYQEELHFKRQERERKRKREEEIQSGGYMLENNFHESFNVSMLPPVAQFSQRFDVQTHVPQKSSAPSKSRSGCGSMSSRGPVTCTSCVRSKVRLQR